MILPIILYGYEFWSLTFKEEHRSKVLLEEFIKKYEEDIWRLFPSMAFPLGACIAWVACVSYMASCGSVTRTEWRSMILLSWVPGISLMINCIYLKHVIITVLSLRAHQTLALTSWSETSRIRYGVIMSQYRLFCVLTCLLKLMEPSLKKRSTGDQFHDRKPTKEAYRKYWNTVALRMTTVIF